MRALFTVASSTEHKPTTRENRPAPRAAARRRTAEETRSAAMKQPTLFDERSKSRDDGGERLTLFALGEFQARGLALADRELPLDRLRGALRRASEALGCDEPDDEAAAHSFDALGAHVSRVPPFVAKHPYRVTVPPELAARALKFYEEMVAPRKSDSTDEAGDAA